MRINLEILALFALMLATTAQADDSPRSLDDRLHHLRIDAPREWTSFPEKPDANHLEVRFTAPKKNGSPWTLRLRQQDVKQSWNVLLGDRRIGRLVRDENDMVVYFAVPVGAINAGANTLRIEQQRGGRPIADDIRVGEVVLHSAAPDQVLNQSTVEIKVIDLDSKQPTPARITIVNAAGALQTAGAASNDHLAVRPGTVYTSTGHARFGLPEGKYTIYAGRGFEYSLATADVQLIAGKTNRQTLGIRRVVPTTGYVACDTHIHTRTHSGHGDATVQERMITIAGEGIELAIATDHNVHVSHDALARSMRVRKYFTPVIGNEVTTRVGHFNIFPVKAGAKTPNHRLSDWKSILEDIYRTPNVKVAILNHARDLHSGVRPFGPNLHNALVGENLDGWAMRFNAMEVINSAATQTDPLKLLHDWLGMLNRGRRITPVGSSDSHDVSRHFVGQGRTYIRCADDRPGQIDVDKAVDAFLRGEVMVSYGLLAEMTVEGKHRSGATVTAGGPQISVAVRVLGPPWVRATRLDLFANGQVIRTVKIPKQRAAELPDGVLWSGKWKIPRPSHDVHLVAIATGPGVDGLYWKTAKAYQPTSPMWKSQVIGCSGAIWIDVDGDGKVTSAYEYARRAFDAAGRDQRSLIHGLMPYDAAVAAQAAHLYQASGQSLLSDKLQADLKDAPPAVQVGFRRYTDAWRQNQKARAGG